MLGGAIAAQRAGATGAGLGLADGAELMLKNRGHDCWHRPQVHRFFKR
jgi:hypothetical protein